MSKYGKKGNKALVVGYTNLGPVLDEMKQTDATATIFNDDVRNYVTDAAFTKAWGVWYPDWKKFYEDRFNARTNMDIFNSDQIAERARQYKQDLARFQATYRTMKGADGKPLPQNAPNVPITPPPPDQQKQDGIPLWTFLLGAGVIGLGIFLYWRFKKTGQMLSARRRVLEEDVLPLALGAHFGPETGHALAKAATAHDAPSLPAAPSSCGGCGRDMEMKLIPRAASRYYLSGR